MEIERINENTLKLSISYIDIEQRGFQRDEIWYNRERSEELFWEVMDEINEDFNPNGPLWIQVQAMEKGLEIIVTQAHIPGLTNINNSILENMEPITNFDSFVNSFKEKGLFVSEEMEGTEDDEDELNFEFVIAFKDFESLIKLSSLTNLDDIETELYYFKNQYYLLTKFSEDTYSEKLLFDQLAILLEYGEETKMTSVYLQEYGKIIINNNVFSQLRTYFK